MSDYSKGQIYKITDIGMNKCYIGSSVQKLCKRMAQHRKDYHQYKNGKRQYYNSVFSLFDEFGVENCKIVWIKNHPCNSKEELEAEEGKHQKEYQCVNKFMAGRSSKERYEDNKDTILEKQKIYNEKNKEKVSEKKKQDYQRHRETRLVKAKEYREREGQSEKHKEYCKEWYQNKKDELSERQKQIRRDNPELAREKDKRDYERKKANKNRPWTCECGLTVCFSARLNHLKTKKHQQYLQNQNNPQE